MQTMKKQNRLLLSYIIIGLIIITACSKTAVPADPSSPSPPSPPPPPAVTEVKLGNQIWSNSNLDVTKFQNGQDIPEAQSDSEWKKAAIDGTPAWCYYNQNPENGTKYGKLYNWYAVIDSRGLAPSGWHIPTDAEWEILAKTLGDGIGMNVSGIGVLGTATKMKTTSGWLTYDMGKDGNGDNTSGFTALPAGFRYCNIIASPNVIGFANMGDFTFWWTNTEKPSTPSAWHYSVKSSHTAIIRNIGYRANGYSVRCIKN